MEKQQRRQSKNQGRYAAKNAYYSSGTIIDLYVYIGFKIQITKT